MEEVDSIILHFLKHLDLNISEDFKSLGELSAELAIESASKCLTTINPTLKLPPKLPSGISQRIEIAAQIASACKDLGYKNDVGYQTFLYCNETELRHVLMFLIENLPSEENHNTTIVSPGDQKLPLLQQISQKIGEEINAMWIPQCCKNTNEIQQYNKDHLNSIDDAEIIAHLIKINKSEQISEIASECSDENVNNFHIQPQENKDLNKSLKELKELAIVLRQKLNDIESENNCMEIELQQATSALGKAQSQLHNIQNIFKNIGLENMEGPVHNVLEKVKQSIEALHLQCEKLTSLNLLLRVEIDKVKNKKPSAESEHSQCKKTFIHLKDTAKALKEEYNAKEHLRDQLKKNYSKLRGSANTRSLYTKRIYEIIGNVDKQNLEIAKILEDTRQLQKEINNLESQLDRCFSIADETLFGDAKKDDQAKKAYKLLALLHSECNSIVSLVNDTGILAREIVELEDNIKAEKIKGTEDILEKIRIDISKLQEESNAK